MDDSIQNIINQYSAKKKMYEKKLDNDLKNIISNNKFVKFLGYSIKIDGEKVKLSISYGNNTIKIKQDLLSRLSEFDKFEILDLKTFERKKILIKLLTGQYSFTINDDYKYIEINKYIYNKIENDIYLSDKNNIVYIIEPLYEMGIMIGTTPIYKTTLEEAINIDPHDDLDRIHETISELRICKDPSMKSYKDPLYIYKDNSKEWIKIHSY